MHSVNNSVNFFNLNHGVADLDPLSTKRPPFEFFLYIKFSKIHLCQQNFIFDFKCHKMFTFGKENAFKKEYILFLNIITRI